jgi:dGTPase
MMERVYEHPSVLRQVARGKMVLTRLFNEFVENPGLLPRSTQEKLAIPGSELHEIVARFIAGMTDRFALDTYAEIFEPPYRGMTGRPD